MEIETTVRVANSCQALDRLLGAILAGRPELDLRFEHRVDGEVVASLDSRDPAGDKPE